MSRLSSTISCRRRPQRKATHRKSARHKRPQPVRLESPTHSPANRFTDVQGSIALIRVNNTDQCIDIENDECAGQDQNLAGWILRRDADKKTKIICKFPEDFVLKSGCTVRVSCGKGTDVEENEKLILHQPDSKPWDVGSSITISLMDADGDERAVMKQNLAPL